MGKERGRYHPSPPPPPPPPPLPPSVEVFNILPVEDALADHPGLSLPEVRAAMAALVAVGDLAEPVEISVTTAEEGEYRGKDMLDWLGSWFGFQRDNVRNQREHIVLLLANYQMQMTSRTEMKLDYSAVERFRKKTLKNYSTWCSFLDLPSHVELSSHHQHPDERKEMLYTCLYLLIWGEAANLRFMPECLCFIFHHMADELNMILKKKAGFHSNDDEQKVLPASYGRNGFLLKVVTPLYTTLSQEASTENAYTRPHSSWRNYDDMNEYFWTNRCIKNFPWPIQRSSSYLYWDDDQLSTRKVGKTGFVEQRSFLNIFRSFDHLWMGYILMLQAMVIVAWNGSGVPWIELYDRDTQARLLSIFLTWSCLRVLQSLVDAGMQYSLISREMISIGVRMVLKISVGSCWVIIFSVLYFRMWEQRNRDQGWSNEASLRTIQMLETAGVFILPEVLALVLFALPWIRNVVERSDWAIFRPVTWWFYSPAFVGRGLREGVTENINYTLFWLIVLFAKFSFSFFFQIQPLIQPSKRLLRLSNVSYAWQVYYHDDNQSIMLVLWIPVILIYFMDTQIWYGFFSGIVGAMLGLFSHLGEIRNVNQFRLRFPFFASAMQFNLMAEDSMLVEEKRSWKHAITDMWKRFKLRYGLGTPFHKIESNMLEAGKFGHIWNEIITVFREEDLISDRELELMEIPLRSWSMSSVIKWPTMLLASQALLALRQAYSSLDLDDVRLWSKICKNEYRKCAVIECYESIKQILLKLIKEGYPERSIVEEIFRGFQSSISKQSFTNDYHIKELQEVHSRVCRLIDVLLEKPGLDKRQIVVDAVQSLYEALYYLLPVRRWGGGSKMLLLEAAKAEEDPDPLFVHAIELPDPSDDAFFKQLRRVYTLLISKESVENVPKNLNARSRIAFFSNSLFMNMPHAPSVESMLSFSVLTTYYKEDILYSREQLRQLNEDGVSIIFYLQKIYPDEWENFLERMNREHCLQQDELWDVERARELRLWASYRGQTLARTVRGMMYYYRALKMLAYLETASEIDIEQGRELLRAMSMRRDVINPKAPKAPLSGKRNLSHTRSALGQLYWKESLKTNALLKFTYVVTCELYGSLKVKRDAHADDILFLMKNNEALRIAYVDKRKDDRDTQSYYSVLVKYDRDLEKEVEIYRVQLPGHTKLGEGKAENQNQALIFTRGDALQTIDMNQDNSFEEALKIRNLLQEFQQFYGLRRPQILGIRENVFTGSVSSLAWFMSVKEMSFVTIGQRVCANPLKVRMHYGHPDVFDRLWFLTRGGLSKASRIINLNQGIFAGFNCTLRGGNVTHHEYIQVGKGRDVGFNQIALFEAKVAIGNGEQMMSRDVYRLGHRLDFFRMLSFYYSSVGFYVNNLIAVLTVYLFLWGRVYLALSGVDKSLRTQTQTLGNDALMVILNQQFIVQIGLLTAFPLVIENSLEHGLSSSLWDFFLMQLQMLSIFFAFLMGTQAHYFGRTLLHGGAKYQSSNRGFVVKHEKFSQIYRLFARSHFVKALELILLLVVYEVYGTTTQDDRVVYILLTFVSWFLALSWLVGPFLFNPVGFDWLKTVYDFDDFVFWIWCNKNIVTKQDQSWEVWWIEEQEYLKETGFWGKAMEIILSLRFFFFQYGMVYHLNIASHNRSVLVYLLSWIIVILFLIGNILLAKASDKYSAKQHLYYRAVQLFVVLFVALLLVLLFELTSFGVMDFVVSFLAFLPTGWGLLSIALVLRPVLQYTVVWPVVVSLAQVYEFGMGILVMVPVALLSWLPGFQRMQTRLLFNQAFSRGLQISQILTAKKQD